MDGERRPFAEVLAEAFDLTPPMWLDVLAKPFFMPGRDRGLRDLCWDFPKGFQHNVWGGQDVGYSWVVLRRGEYQLEHGESGKRLRDVELGEIRAKIGRYGGWLTAEQFFKRVYKSVSNRWFVPDGIPEGIFFDYDPAHVWQNYRVIPIPWYAMVPFGEAIPRTSSRVVHKEKVIMLSEHDYGHYLQEMAELVRGEVGYGITKKLIRGE